MSLPDRPLAEARNLLLVTATIAPNKDMPGNALTDATERLGHYEHALRSYLSFPGPYPDQILFCENSGYDLTSLRAIAQNENPHRKPVHFWSFTPDTSPKLGKGYSEMEILDRAYETYLADLSERTVVWKMTGRLVVKNLDRLIRSRPPASRVYIDMRKLPFVGHKRNISCYADTRIMAYTPAAYKDLLYQFKDGRTWVNERGLFDHLYAAARTDKAITPRFRIQPRVQGVDGTLLKDYGGPAQVFKDNVRGLARTVTPWLWI
ncbi:MAG: hypothetical protein AAFQ55_05560 [Pseudomonadota bacterium]